MAINSPTDSVEKGGQHCPQCDKLLHDVACDYCGGKGYIRKLLFFKSTCSLCHGRRARAKCPDEHSHIYENILKLRDDSFRNNWIPVNARRAQRLLRGIDWTQLSPPSKFSPPPAKFSPPPAPQPWEARYPIPWHQAHPRHNSFQPQP